MVEKDNIVQIKAALQERPVSVSVNAMGPWFMNYSSGIFDGYCGYLLDHATNLVGWGSEGGTEYWIMRNSWSTSWGEDGYMRIAIKEGRGYCSIQKEALYPLVV